MSAAAAADAPTAPATAAAFTPEELRHPDNFLTAEQNALLAAEPGTTAPVLVTGGNGFIASFIVGILLRQGYTVRATVRDPSNAAKTAHLEAMAEMTGSTLEIVAGNLLDADSMAAAVAGCDWVLHTASPYAVNVDDPQTELVDPAVNGTLHVLDACATHGVSRVVLTSSVAAITDSPEKDHIYTEADWNTSSSLSRNPYYYSKRLAEEAGWEWAESHPDINFSVINPFVVLGPALNDSINESAQIIRGLLMGEFPALIDLSWCMVDVRDVALAHVLAIEKANTEGRNICALATKPMTEVVSLLREHFPQFDDNLPTRNLACKAGTGLVKIGSYFGNKGTGQYLRTNLGKAPNVSNDKIKEELGMVFRDLDETILQCAGDLVARDLVRDLD